jgi:hypothetical protein
MRTSDNVRLLPGQGHEYLADLCLDEYAELFLDQYNSEGHWTRPSDEDVATLSGFELVDGKIQKTAKRKRSVTKRKRPATGAQPGKDPPPDKRPGVRLETGVAEKFGLTSRQAQQMSLCISKISDEDAALFCSNWRTCGLHERNAVAGYVPGCDELKSVSNQFLDGVLTLFFNRLVEKQPQWATLNAYHTTCMPGGVYANIETSHAFTTPLHEAGDFDVKNLIFAAYLPGHWVLCVVSHSTRTITICDPLGGAVARTRGHLVHTINQWMASERHSIGKPHVDDYSMAVNPWSLPTQNDSISCGPFVCAYAYYVALYGCFPTHYDFTGAQNGQIRFAVLHTCLNNSCPDPPGGIRVVNLGIKGRAFRLRGQDVEMPDVEMSDVDMALQKAIFESLTW